MGANLHRQVPAWNHNAVITRGNVVPVTTTKRRYAGTRPPAPVTRYDGTLAELSDQLAEACGITTFASVTRALAEVRHDLAALRAQRRCHYERLATTVSQRDLERTFLVGDRPRRLRWVTPAPRPGKPSVSSETTWKADSSLWLRSRDLAPLVQVSAPVRLAHDVPTPTGRIETVVTDYARLGRDIAAATATETDLAGLLRAIAEQCRWDGQPYTTTDGWKIGTTRLQYSSEKLREVDPDFWNSHATTPAPRQPEPSLRLVSLSDEDQAVYDIDMGDGALDL